MTLSTGEKVIVSLGIVGALGLTLAIAFTDKIVKRSK